VAFRDAVKTTSRHVAGEVKTTSRHVAGEVSPSESPDRRREASRVDPASARRSPPLTVEFINDSTSITNRWSY
jgi:hypothetical protein